MNFLRFQPNFDDSGASKTKFSTDLEVFVAARGTAKIVGGQQWTVWLQLEGWQWQRQPWRQPCFWRTPPGLFSGPRKAA